MPRGWYARASRKDVRAELAFGADEDDGRPVEFLAHAADLDPVTGRALPVAVEVVVPDVGDRGLVGRAVVDSDVVEVAVVGGFVEVALHHHAQVDRALDDELHAA